MPLIHNPTWKSYEGKKSSVNSNALKFLYEALDKSIIDRIPKCTNAYELWNSLELLNEGNNELNACNIDSNSSNDEICNLDCMDIENLRGESENEITIVYENEISDYDEMLDMLNDLHDKYDALRKKCNLIKEEHTSHQHEHASCLDKIRALEIDDICLKTKLENDVSIDHNEHVSLVKQIHALSNENMCLNVEHEHCIENLQNEASTSKSSCACKLLKIKNDDLNKKLEDLQCIVTKFT